MIIKKYAYLIFIYLLYSMSLYPKTLFIESKSLLYSGGASNDMSAHLAYSRYLSKSSMDVVYDFLYDGDRVYIYNYSKDEKEIIESNISNVKFLGKFLMFFYRHFSKDSIFYCNTKKEMEYLEGVGKDYVEVIFDDSSIDKNNLIKLRNNYNKKILIAYEIRESIKIEVSKKDIKIIDGDTIAIDDTRYRLLGIDTPEIGQEYGTNALIHLKTLIEKSNKVFISPASFDIYDRVLAHLFVDDNPVAYSMIKNKLAFQTITSFGDNGFPNISSNIIELSKKQGRMPFLNPNTYRDRLKKGDTNNLTIKRAVVKKKVVKPKKEVVAKKVVEKKVREKKVKETKRTKKKVTDDKIDNIVNISEDILETDNTNITTEIELDESLEYTAEEVINSDFEYIEENTIIYMQT